MASSCGLLQECIYPVYFHLSLISFAFLLYFTNPPALMVTSLECLFVQKISQDTVDLGAKRQRNIT